MEGNVSKIEFRADRCKHNISYPVSSTSDTGSQVSSSPSGIEYDRQTWSRDEPACISCRRLAAQYSVFFIHHKSVEVVYAKVVGIIVRATGTNDFNKFICVKGSSVCALTPARKQAWKLRELKKGKIEVKVISLTSLCFASHNEYHATGSNARRWCMQLKTALHARDLEELCHNRQTLKT